MRRTKLLLTLLVLLALGSALAGCGGATGSAELVPHDDPVPEGTPVMYEFFTLT